MSKIKIETIFDLMKNKDEKGFELLNKYYYRTIYGVAFTILKDGEQSKDVVQNVFLKLYELPYNKYPKTKELTWLYTVTKNEALGLLRKEKNLRGIDPKLHLHKEDFSIEEIVDMDSYYSLIRSLNPKQKRVITMKVLGGMSHREIAEMLDKPIGTIQWLYNTSIKKLRVTLEVLTICVLISGGSFIKKYMTFIQKPGGVPELDGPIEIVPKDERALNWAIVMGIVFFVSIVVWILFFKKSYKIYDRAIGSSE